MRFFPIMIVALHACAGSDDSGVAEKQQDEIIEVHACQPGYIEVGDSDTRVCVDPWHGDGGGGPDPTGGGPGREPSTPGGGGTPTPSPPPPGGPGPKPDRKQCRPELGEEGCLACCYYNHDQVDGWECRKKGRRSKKAEEKCWREAAQELGRCQRIDCNRLGIPPITAVQR